MGRAIALLFAREAASVVVADNGRAVDGSGTSAGPAEAVAAEIAAAGGTALASVADVSVGWRPAPPAPALDPGYRAATPEIGR